MWEIMVDMHHLKRSRKIVVAVPSSTPPTQSKDIIIDSELLSSIIAINAKPCLFVDFILHYSFC